MDFIQYSGLWILIALAFNMWALMSVVRSGAGLPVKMVWAVALVFLPGLGFVVWYLIGPRQVHA